MSYDSQLEPPENKMTELDHAIGHTFEASEALAGYVLEMRRRGRAVNAVRLQAAVTALDYARGVMEAEKYPF